MGSKNIIVRVPGQFAGSIALVLRTRVCLADAQALPHPARQEREPHLIAEYRIWLAGKRARTPTCQV